VPPSSRKQPLSRAMKSKKPPEGGFTISRWAIDTEAPYSRRQCPDSHRPHTDLPIPNDRLGGLCRG
jgi:hypothetical protein